MSIVATPSGSMTRRRLAAALLVPLVGVAALSAGAAGASHSRQAAGPQLGILGDAQRFTKLTGQRSSVRHAFIGWHQPQTISKLLEQLSPFPMLAIKTGGTVSPLDIAQGRGDAFLARAEPRDRRVG